MHIPTDAFYHFDSMHFTACMMTLSLYFPFSFCLISCGAGMEVVNGFRSSCDQEVDPVGARMIT